MKGNEWRQYVRIRHVALVPVGPSGHMRCFKHLYTFQAVGACFCLLPPTATYLLLCEHSDRPSPPTMAMHQLMRLSHQSFKLHGSLEVGTSKWHRRRQGGERLRTLPPLVGVGVTSIWGACPGCRGLLAKASALAGVRMIAYILPLAGVGVTSSIGAGLSCLSWRAVWAARIQGSCTCQPFLLNSIFENLGAYGGCHHHSLECCSRLEPHKAPRQHKKANGWRGDAPKDVYQFFFSH